ncbi:hypothetical protein OG819_12175 [Streptomyces sp. NBC_01549]|uniref:FlgD immunoglobulin-like domain containing protein n=1 Tax=Streptomyces sp. NBC_01549 TaxID=2975874 RepID=UPI00224EC835|nr:FlgD immunoglobulin-like domain containing protein [Streptomyces sp. NBC_01549]MCX4590486.1 hypothetical protein [Streptomyces sp. NBC_01549]
MTVRNTAGATVRTLSGSDARGLQTADWDGKDSAGRLVANGTYTWTLTAQPADGQGAALNRSGSLTVMAGAAAPRDYAGNDGVGDLFTLNSSDALTVQRGSGNGTLGSKVSGSGWPTSAKFVPYGHLSSDRCNDILVRLSSGALRAYRPACGKAPGDLAEMSAERLTVDLTASIHALLHEGGEVHADESARHSAG